MFERSEFGPRAPPSEKRRGPDRLHRSGSRPATAVLVTFAKTKVTRASARKLLILILPFSFCFHSPPGDVPQAQRGRSRSTAFRALSARATFLCLCKETWRKETHPASAPGAAHRVRGAGGISDGASCPCGKRRTSLCGAPMGSCPPAPPLRRGPGGQKPRSKSTATATATATACPPLLIAATAAATPASPPPPATARSTAAAPGRRARVGRRPGRVRTVSPVHRRSPRRGTAPTVRS